MSIPKVNTGSEFSNIFDNCLQVLDVYSVLNVFHSLVDKFSIYKVYNSQGNPDAVAGDLGRQYLYFPRVGLLRLHSLLGDYHQAI